MPEPSLEELFALHLRLTQDKSNAIQGMTPEGSRVIEVTPEGKAWLKDWRRYEWMHRCLNNHQFRGSGPADKALNQRFGVALEEEE